MSFDILPSQLLELYWRVSYQDIRYKIKIVISEKLAGHTQNFENLIVAIDRVFNGSEESSSEPKAKPAQTWEQAQAAALAVFS